MDAGSMIESALLPPPLAACTVRSKVVAVMSTIRAHASLPFLKPPHPHPHPASRPTPTDTHYCSLNSSLSALPTALITSHGILWAFAPLRL